jgi:ATP-binding cassette, subfamily G (WHITE), member 2, PDR
LLNIGAIPGQETVSGARWLELSYGYTTNHLWSNLGIIIAFFIFFTTTFLVATELSSPPPSRGEVLVFQKGKEPKHFERVPAAGPSDEEKGHRVSDTSEGSEMAGRTTTMATVDAVKENLQAPKDIFTWRKVCCDVRIKGETRRLLSDVAGYVKPGTLTALMGESGAGKTTLLDTYGNYLRSV